MQLEQSNFDLLQFASVASHDLKEPLRKIQTFGNLLHENIKDKIDGKDSNYLEKDHPLSKQDAGVNTGYTYRCPNYPTVIYPIQSVNIAGYHYKYHR
jgi:signal transduction histidine kinase